MSRRNNNQQSAASASSSSSSLSSSSKPTSSPPVDAHFRHHPGMIRRSHSPPSAAPINTVQVKANQQTANNSNHSFKSSTSSLPPASILSSSSPRVALVPSEVPSLDAQLDTLHQQYMAQKHALSTEQAQLQTMYKNQPYILRDKLQDVELKLLKLEQQYLEYQSQLNSLKLSHLERSQLNMSKWEDDVEEFHQTNNKSLLPPPIAQVDIDSPLQKHKHHGGVLTLDSESEERRLDELRERKRIEKEKKRQLRIQSAKQGIIIKDLSDSDSDSDVCVGYGAPPSSSSSLLSSSGAASIATRGSGWVDASTTLAVDRHEQLPSKQFTREQQEQLRAQQYAIELEKQRLAEVQAQLERQSLAARALQYENENELHSEHQGEGYGDAFDDAPQDARATDAQQREAVAEQDQELTPEQQRQLIVKQKRPPLLLNWSSLDVHSFFQSAVPRGGWLHCRLIKRSSGGLSAFLHPTYEMYTEDIQGSIFLASARKSSKTKPDYHLFFDRNDYDKKGPSYAGKVQASMTRSQYNIYDSGHSKGESGKPPREEFGHITYKPHLAGKTPRKLAVLLPILVPEQQADKVQSEFKNEFLSTSTAYSHLWKSLQECQMRQRTSHPWLCLLNKPPRYHAESGQYVLDFCGRAPKVSVKNFQLVYPEEPDEVLFQLGRLDEENFSVDYRFPISPVQAFAIALSSLDYKWTVD